jgi:hypothetical protein
MGEVGHRFRLNKSWLSIANLTEVPPVYNYTTVLYSVRGNYWIDWEWVDIWWFEEKWRGREFELGTWGETR